MGSSFFEANIMGIIVCVLILVNSNRTYSSARTKQSLRIFSRIILCLITSFSCDLIYYTLEGSLFKGAIAISYLLMVAYYLANILSTYYWATYV